METATIVVLVILILVLLFFGYTMWNSNSTGRATSPGVSQPQVYGGGCGR